MAKSESYIKAQKKYDEKRKHEQKRILISFNRENDSAILETLMAHGNKNNYIRQLIRYDMEHHIIMEESSDTGRKIEAMQKDLEDSLIDWSEYGIEAKDDHIKSIKHTDTGVAIEFKDGSRKIISKR